MSPLERCFGRISGDKFGAILVNCPETEIPIAAEKILEAARNTIIETPSGPIHVTVSVGAVQFPMKVRTAADTMTKADVALRDAKLFGRDCFALYDCTEQQKLNNRNSMVIAERVQRAIQENRIRFAYQPVVEAHSHRISHYECLLRMVEIDESVTTAAHFMPAVEDLGMIRPIDRMVLEAGI